MSNFIQTPWREITLYFFGILKTTENKSTKGYNLKQNQEIAIAVIKVNKAAVWFNENVKNITEFVSDSLYSLYINGCFS